MQLRTFIVAFPSQDSGVHPDPEDYTIEYPVPEECGGAGANETVPLLSSPPLPDPPASMGEGSHHCSLPMPGAPTHVLPHAAVATPCRAPEARANAHGSSGIPNLGQVDINKPDPQMLRISEAAADGRLCRVMTPSLRDGQYKVSPEIVKRYRKGGKSKRSLMKLFETCGYDKDRFL